jgi:hypothetical protein
MEKRKLHDQSNQTSRNTNKSINNHRGAWATKPPQILAIVRVISGFTIGYRDLENNINKAAET